MTGKEVLKLEVKDLMELVNKDTVAGMKVEDVAKKLGIGDKTLRNRAKAGGYKYNPNAKQYILAGNNEEITLNNNPVARNKKVIRSKKAITKEEQPSNNEGISEETISNDKGLEALSTEEIKELRELLKIKEQLLLIAGITQDKGITRNNKGITILDAVNLDKSHRKKATFNMDLELLDILNIYEKESSVSKSDVVNIALIEYFKTRGINKK